MHTTKANPSALHLAAALALTAIACSPPDRLTVQELEAFALEQPRTGEELAAFRAAAGAVDADEIPACSSIGCPLAPSGSPSIWSPCPPYWGYGVFGELCWCRRYPEGDARLCTP